MNREFFEKAGVLFGDESRPQARLVPEENITGGAKLPSGLVEPTTIFSEGFATNRNHMRSALSFFVHLLVLIILLRIFSPGLADELIVITGKALAIVSNGLDLVVEQSQSTHADTLYPTP